jgi:outer membrane scaffolding protein for murein synthesis (MipA/OmpV family)
MLAAALAGTLPSGVALAGEDDGPAPTATKSSGRWDVTLGIGAGTHPTYEGSDRHVVAPVPYIDINYGDWLSLGPDGLSAYWRKGDLRMGGGITRHGERRDSDTNGIIDQGDDRLKGLGTIDSAIGLKLFVSYMFGRVNVSGSVTRFHGSSKNGAPKNDGTLVKIGAATPFQVTDKLTITAAVGTTWADEKYAQTFFGVTDVQSRRSRFTPFKAGSGLKDVDLDIGVSYRFNEHWSMLTLLQAKSLRGDAADSPITYSDTNVSFIATINYRY